MEGLTIRREDHALTFVTFTLKTNPGPYLVEIVIHHTPTEGRFVFDRFRVARASRR